MPESKTDFKSSRWLRMAPFALALLCFLLPFEELSSSGEKVLTFTGVQFVTGTEIAVRDRMSGKMSTRETGADGRVRLIAVLIAVGILACLLSDVRGRLLPAVVGVIALSLMYMRKAAFDADALEATVKSGVNVAYESGSGFLLCGVALVAGVAASIYQLKGAPKPPEKGDNHSTPAPETTAAK